MRFGPPVGFARRPDGHHLAYQVLGDAPLDLVWRCCVAPTHGRLKANLGWDQIAKTSSSNATATRRLVGSSTASS
jgi:hypothetical protein